jgi:hypothetical protein
MNVGLCINVCGHQLINRAMLLNIRKINVDHIIGECGSRRKRSTFPCLRLNIIICADQVIRHLISLELANSVATAQDGQSACTRGASTVAAARASAGTSAVVAAAAAAGTRTAVASGSKSLSGLSGGIRLVCGLLGSGEVGQ